LRVRADRPILFADPESRQTLFGTQSIETGVRRQIHMIRLLHPKRFAILAIAVLPIQARAEAVDAVGLPHCFQVSEDVWRGAQPTMDGWTSLSKLGVTTVIDLRHKDEHDTFAEERMVRSAGMRYVNIPMYGLTTPTEEQIAKAMDLMIPGEKVFVHCAKGMDRTGAVIAAYRIRHQQWDNQKALAEARTLGLHWYERGKMRFILGYRPTPGLALPDSTKLAAEPRPMVDSVGVSTIAR